MQSIRLNIAGKGRFELRQEKGSPKCEVWRGKEHIIDTPGLAMALLYITGGNFEPELSEEEIRQQDKVDNAIYAAAMYISGDTMLPWDIGKISSVREAFFSAFGFDESLYPFLREE